ncbi:unnamed protein product [Nezara viridula]|uniref:Uncharacterized protein n=1 Tax=Nezara viridula TaxID=85310 RepID=A0A9P0HPQ2_NEZVI|nr:unnamed protein product [Nezara viridula]
MIRRRRCQFEESWQIFKSELAQLRSVPPVARAHPLDPECTHAVTSPGRYQGGTRRPDSSGAKLLLPQKKVTPPPPTRSDSGRKLVTKTMREYLRRQPPQPPSRADSEPPLSPQPIIHILSFDTALGFRSSSQGQVNSAVVVKEHSSVHIYLGLALRKPRTLSTRLSALESELERMARQRAQPNLESLKQSLVRAVERFPQEVLRAAIND